MRKIVKKIIAWSLVVLWMCVIFAFSSQEATTSKKTSGKTLIKIASTISKDFKKLPPKKQMKKVEPFQTAIRKLAHLTEYAILGILSYIAFLLYKKKKLVFSATTLCSFYAITDEIHQLFVKGRACRWYDVLIDTTGAVIGIMIIIGILKIIRKRGVLND